MKALFAFALLLAAPAAAQPLTRAQLEEVRRVDLRLATIAHRLVTANAPLCAERQPATGLVLHAIDQYAADTRANARAVFGFARAVAVEAVVPGSPAAAAGVRADDGVAAIAGRILPAAGDATSSITRDATVALVTAVPVDRPLMLTLVRGSQPMAATLTPLPGCRAAFEVLLGAKLEASSDGRIVQIGVGFLERFSDAEIAVVVAHELAHVILRHRARLEAAGVQWGLLAEFGRNRRLFRRTEDDADLLSVALLHNAGYDPASAAAFWRAHGGKVGGGFFRARTHGSAGARAAAMAQAAAAIPAGAKPYRPPVLATRDQPLD